MRKVADIHAHVFPEKLADKAPASISAFYGGMEVACHPATPQKMAFYEQEAGITRFVMSNSATTAHQVHSINDFLPQAVKNIPGAIAFGSIFPGMDGAIEELERAKALGIRGSRSIRIFRRCRWMTGGRSHLPQGSGTGAAGAVSYGRRPV